MSFAGLPTILFLEPPTAQALARLTGYRAIGIAGVARSKAPEWMDSELPPIFALLAGLNTPVTHYKTCSTLDSSPRMGSIRRAIDLAVSVFKSRRGAAEWVPLLVAAPQIRRYQAFGNLFATCAGVNYRLDRHPVMRRHPATPMARATLHFTSASRRFLRALDEFTSWPTPKAAIQFQILTMVRPGETRGAKRNEFDFAESVWDIPPERMKMRRPHAVPLSKQALAVVEGPRWCKRPTRC